MYRTENHGGRTRYVCDERGCRYATQRALRMERHQAEQHRQNVAIEEQDAPVSVFMLRDAEGAYVTAIADGEAETGDIADALAFETEAEAQAAAEGVEGLEVLEVQIGGGPELEELLKGKVADVTERISQATDRETLRLLAEAESAAKKPRGGVLKAIEARLEELDAEAGA